jgi:hypothetical protein
MRIVRRAKLRDESGVAVVIAIIVLLVCLLLGAAVVSAAIDESTGARRDTAEKRAFEAAQAGLQQTLYRFNELLNTQSTQPSLLDGFCMGTNASVSAGSYAHVSLQAGGGGLNGGIELGSSAYAGTVCPPDTESLGNGAFYTSWVSTAVTVGSNLTCAGTTIAGSNSIGERCVTSLGFICPPSVTSVSQLDTTPSPCPKPVYHRVEERASANVGQPDFPAGAVGLNGILVRNSGRLLGTTGTNGQLDVENTGFVQGPAELAPGAPWPIIGSPNAFIGTCGQAYSGTTSWPSSCVTRVNQAFTLPKPNFGAVYCGTTTIGSWATTTASCPTSATDANFGYDYTQPSGDWLIANAFLPCATQVPACPHDTFTGANCKVATSASQNPFGSQVCWDPFWRTLNLPNKAVWTLTGSQYNLCGLELSGQASALMAPNLRTAIFVDSDADTRTDGSAPPCPAPSNAAGVNSGEVNFGNQATLVNNTINPTTGQPDSTALQFYVYGMKTVSQTSTYNNNDCTQPGATGTTSPCVVFGQSGGFQGAIFAANSDVLVQNSGNDYGAVAARTLVYGNTGTFTQDPADQAITTYSLGLYYRTAWDDCLVQPTSTTNPMSGC